MHKNKIPIYSNRFLYLRPSDLVCYPMQCFVAENKSTEFEINQTNHVTLNA